ncbi:MULTISPECIES: RICIN domain-containing protein [Nostoc]|uniref:RICIN domain-containing protein n=2 Tax=Nostoc TaxID=1177 RepID=A0ABR8IKB9_9NOSO|nr:MULTISPECIES: RICIN domain-containing protein [Nostoc]MBD2565740.1 RICIN domain-containing protein [Nostoc linckia FACHB-391]MBD2651319.1 RICIN domain-containing protein [Nostoc foliaceum FACHB-393]
MVATSPIAGQYYYVIAKHSGKALDMTNDPVDGGKAVQWDNGKVDHFKWLLEDAGDGYFYLIAKHSGKALTVDGGLNTDGANVIQWTNQKVDHFKWLLEDASDGYFYLIAKHSGKALAVYGGLNTDGANVIQWTNQKVDHFKWKFEAVPLETIAPSIPPISENGTIKTEVGKTYKVQITVNVPANIGYNNSFGIFAINDDGSTAGVKPGDPNYAATVVKNRIPLPNADQGSYQKGQTFKYDLPGGPKYSVFLIANGTPDLFLQKNLKNEGSKPPLAYFFNTAANPDGKSHVKVISPNEYGFEDIYGGGDQDFDDLIVKLETLSVVS